VLLGRGSLFLFSRFCFYVRSGSRFPFLADVSCIANLVMYVVACCRLAELGVLSVLFLGVDGWTSSIF
jgi:hypothetical protein